MTGGGATVYIVTGGGATVYIVTWAGARVYIVDWGWSCDFYSDRRWYNSLVIGWSYSDVEIKLLLLCFVIQERNNHLAANQKPVFCIKSEGGVSSSLQVDCRAW